MVTASVLGAAAGTGLALVIAMTIVVYKYYAQRRKRKEWTMLTSVAASRSTNLRILQEQRRDFSIPKERCQIQPKRSDIVRSGGGFGGGGSLGSGIALPSATLSSSSPPLASFLASHDIPLRRASTCSVQIPRLLSVDEERSSPLSERRGSAFLKHLLDLNDSEIQAHTNKGTFRVTLERVHDFYGYFHPEIVEGTIQPDLYKKKDTIIVDSQGICAGIPNLGRLHFRLKYDFHRSDLIVHIIEAHDLASSENGGFNDPYVKVSMSSAVDTKCRQTKIQRKATNPYFNEIFKFPIALDDLSEKLLLLQVFDFDKFSRNDVVGEIRLNMNEVDVTSDVEVWSEIRKNKKAPGETQELLFSLSYLPSAERLTVVLLKARNLVSPSCGAGGEALNPFVKVYLLQDGRRQKKKKSSTRRSCNNPVWNEAVAFNVPASTLPHVSLELRLLNNDETIGLCAVGSKVEGLGEVHWNDMIQNSRKSVAMWHTLK